MPIYDYLCSACRHRIEVIHGINDPGPLYCPSCGTAGTMRKAMVSPAVHFKGSGWAKKDRSSSSRAKARAGSGAASSSDSGGSGSSGEGSSSEVSSGEAAGPKKGDDTTKATSGEATKASPPVEA